MSIGSGIAVCGIWVSTAIAIMSSGDSGICVAAFGATVFVAMVS